MEIIPIYTKVEKLIEIKRGVVVMESTDGFPVKETNIYMVDANGDILWKAEKPDPRVLFTKIKLNEDSTISTFTSDGRFCELNLETGKIISSSSFR
jgi:outer membrane protein assembly factor BamB